MGLAVLERLKIEQRSDEEIVIKTVTNGNLKVQNVPFVPFRNGHGPSGEKEYIPADVMYKLSKMFRYMLDNNILEMDFKDFT